MDEAYYLDIFKNTASQFEKRVLSQKKIEVANGIYLDSVFLKLYKLSWVNFSPDPLTSPSRIFFSTWINDKAIKQGRLFYNIHALKLRQMDGYNLTSRQFAADFRKMFMKFEKQWPNVSTGYGPLTLMEGWIKLDEATIQADILQLAERFLEMDYLIDELLEKNKK